MRAATTAHPANAMKTALIPAGITEERDDEKGKELSAQRHRALSLFGLRLSPIPFRAFKNLSCRPTSGPYGNV